jgi:hypothetical protein
VPPMKRLHPRDLRVSCVFIGICTRDRGYSWEIRYRHAYPPLVSTIRRASDSWILPPANSQAYRSTPAVCPASGDAIRAPAFDLLRPPPLCDGLHQPHLWLHCRF